MKRKLIIGLLILSLIAVPMFATACEEEVTPPAQQEEEEEQPPAEQEEEEEEVITLMYASPFPATAGRGLRENYYLDWVEEQSGGRVQFERFPDGLLAGVPEQYGLISSGGADLGPMILSRVPDLPLTYLPVISIAGTGEDGAALARAINEHPEISELLQEEWEEHNLTFLGKEGIYFTGGSPDGVGEGILYKESFSTLADLEGKKIGSVGSHPELEALGITVVSLEIPDFYESLSRGVIHGALGSAGQFTEWSLQEVAKFFMAFPTASVSGGGFMAMNLESWDSLPSDIQDIFLEGEAVMYEFSLEQMVLDKQSYIDMFEAAGATLGVLPIADALVILEAVSEGRRAEYLTICENAGKLEEGELIVQYIDEILADMGLD